MLPSDKENQAAVVKDPGAIMKPRVLIRRAAQDEEDRLEVTYGCGWSMSRHLAPASHQKASLKPAWLVIIASHSGKEIVVSS
jgi:hypothetical protein